MDSVVHECSSLTQEDIVYLEKLEGNLGLLADVSRADVLLYCPLDADQAVLVAQAGPHSVLPIYSQSLLGRRVTATEEPAVMRALAEGRHAHGEIRRESNVPRPPAKGSPIVQETYPVVTEEGRAVAALCIETNLIERERHRRRSRAFQKALTQLQAEVLNNWLVGAEQVSPFAEHDGIVVVDALGRIQYVSGIATNLYRKLGYTGDLIKRYITDLDLDDNSLLVEAMEKGECLEGECQLRDLVWVKKAIPLYTARRGLGRLLSPTDGAPQLAGALIAIRDETDTRRQEEELRVKMAMIQEIHHRVKNNMQTVASLLRLQSRRADSEEVRRALHEGINRILAVAVIHEFLAHQDARVINIRDVSQRIINQIQEGVMDREKGIHLDLRGPNIYLPTQPATVCALVINELLLNALEHGYDREEGGRVTVSLKDDGEQVTLSVDDDGVGLPEEFDLSQTSSLGLLIVRTLAEGDLKGSFELRGRDKGVSAVVMFPKHSQGGR